MSKSILKKSVAVLVSAAQLMIPLQGYAQSLQFRAAAVGLRVSEGATLPVVNYDQQNNTSQTVEAGDALLYVAPSTLDLGRVRVDWPDGIPKTIRMTNLGSASLQLGVLRLDTSQFSVTNSCDGVVLLPLTSCEVNAQFTPTQNADTGITGKISVPFSSQGSAAEATISVTGRTVRVQEGQETAGGLGGFGELSGGGSPGVVAGVVNGRYTIQFPVAIINQQTRNYSFTLKSQGETALTYRGLTIRDNDGSFSASSDCPESIAVGSSCTVTAVFAPKTVGNKAATLVVQTNAHTGNNMEVDLKGEAIEVYPVLSSNQERLDFGTLIQSTTAGARSVTLTNTGTAPLTVSSATLSGSVSGVTKSSDTCSGQTIAVNGTCSISLSLSVASPTTVSGLLSVVHDGRLTPTSPYNLVVSGSVVPQTRTLSYSTSQDFGAVDVSSSNSRFITLTNTGNMPVTGFTASSSAPYTVSLSTCASATVQPGSSCNVMVTFGPTSNGTFNRTLTIGATALTTGAPTVSLTGVGQTRTLSASVSSLAFGLSNTQAWSAAQTVTLTNTGNVRVTPYVGNRQEDGRLSNALWIRVSSDTCAAGVDPGQTCQVALQVKPDAANNYSSPVNIYADAGMTTNPRAVTVTATGTPQSYTVDVSSLNYGVIGAKQFVERTVTVTNTSPAGVSLTGYIGSVANPTVSGTGQVGTVSLAQSCPSTLAPQASCQFVVRVTANSYVSLSGADPVTWTGASFTFRYSGARGTNDVIPLQGSVRPTTVTVSAANPSFGEVPTGVSAASAERRFITVTNTGEFPAVYNSIAYGAGTLTLVQDTTQSTCATLAPGASCQLAFYLNEGAAAPTGYKERVVNVRMETLVGTLTVGSATLSATLNPATVEPSVTSVDFGVVGENTTESRTFTFTSTHGGSIEWRGAGSGANGISGSNNLVCGGVTVGYANLIPPGATCTATVSFAPGIAAAAGARSATLAYNFNIGGVNTVLFSIAVSGQVEPVSYAVPFNDLDWGERPAHTALETRYAVVKNTAEKGRLDISSRFEPSPMSTSTDTATYTYEGVALPNCMRVGTLNPGASCYIAAAGAVIAGSPLMVGDRSGVLGLNSRNTFARVDVPFKVVYLPAQTSLSASNLVFETVTPSSTTHQTDLEVTLTNNGAGLAHISNTYTTTGNFWLVNHYGNIAQTVSRSAIAGSPYCYDRSNSYLAQGQSCTLRVRFIPSGAAGEKTGTLSFPVQEPTTKNYSVPLNGVASAGLLEASASSLDFGTQLVGSRTERSFVIANNGNFDLALRNMGIRRSNGSASAWATTFQGTHNCPASLAPGASCVFSVVFTPDENHDWAALSPKEIVYFEHYSNGTWTGNPVPILAIAQGAQLRASQHTHALGYVETGPVSDVFSRTVTYTSAGDAPVRITALTPGVKGSYLELVEGGTCQAGMTLQPGETCTVLLRSLSTYAAFSPGASNVHPTLLSINGHYLGDGVTSQNSEFGVTAHITLTLVAPLSLTRTAPEVVSTQTDTPMSLSGGAFRDGMTLKVDDTTLAYTRDSASQIRFTVPRGLPEGTHTLTLKHTDGLSSAKALPLVVGNFAQDLSATQDVYTAMGDRPLSMSNISATSAQSAVLPDGRVLYYTPGLLSLVNPQTQQVLSSVTQGNLSYDYPVFNGPGTQWGTPAAGGIAVTGNTVHVTDLVVLNNNHWIYTSCWQTCAYAWEYSTRIWERHSVYIISGDTLTLQASSNTAIYNYTTRRQHSTSAGTYEPAFERNVTVSGIQVAADPTNTSLRTVVQRYDITNLGSFGQIYRVSGTTPGTKYNLTASTNDSILGVAQNGSDVYVLNGNSVDTYTASSTSLTAGTRYTYSAALADSGSRGMTFNGAKTELLLGCYAGTAICRIPAVSGALGTINVLAGQVGTAGYADGSYGTALIRARSVGSAPNGASFLQPDVSPQAVRVVKRP